MIMGPWNVNRGPWNVNRECELGAVEFEFELEFE